MGTCDRAPARAAGSACGATRGSACVPAAAILLLCAASVAGCARGVVRPPELAPAPRVSTDAAAPRASTDAAAPTQSASREPRPLDPGEEITPEELSSIPDPVPSGSAAGASDGATGSEEAAAQGGGPPGGRSPATTRLKAAAGDSGQPAFLWRVQIFAARDLGLADRKGKEAAERLGVQAHLEFESPYYKVRLGDYGSEEEARALREKAIEAGYRGAFRVRCAPDTTQYSD